MRVLLNLLECMEFKLARDDLERIKNQFTIQQQQSSSGKAPQMLVRYKDVVQGLSFNQETGSWQVPKAEPMTAIKKKVKKIEQDTVDSRLSIGREEVDTYDSVSNIGGADTVSKKSNRSAFKQIIKAKHPRDASEPKVLNHIYLTL